MKKLMRIIPLLAFVIGMTAALADQSDPVVAKKEALDQGVWVDITGQQEGVDYTCDELIDEDCTRSFDNQGNPIPALAEDGRYIP